MNALLQLDTSDEVASDNPMLDAAKKYHEQGCCIVKVKGKAMDGTYDKAIIKRGQEHIYLTYPAGRNIGILLGEPSKGIVDVDLDWPVASKAAINFFFEMPTSGRKGKPMSHRWVHCTNPGGRVVYDLPTALANDARLPREHTLVVLELRGTGCMTVLPPSTHPSGELIEWGSTGSIADLRNGKFSMSWEQLQRRCGMVAMLSVCSTFYPEKGVRKLFSKALAGVLFDWYEKMVEDGLVTEMTDSKLIEWVDSTVRNVAHWHHEQILPWENVAASTLARIRAHKPVWKLTKLCDLLGYKELVPRFQSWLAQTSDERPKIQFTTGDIPIAIKDVQVAMLNGGAPLYQRSGYLARPLRLEQGTTRAGIGREAGSLVIEPLTSYGLLSMIEQYAVMLQWNGKAMRWQRTDPPVEFRGAFLAAKDLWTMPVIRGISDCPFMRADGTVCQEEGYDAASGILSDYCGATYDPIPEAPTKADAEEALKVINNVIAEFPFDGNSGEDCGLIKCRSRSVALSQILSAHVAQTVDAVPLHLTVAPEARSGKSLGIQTAGIIATGRKPPAMSYTGREEEDEKRLVGAFGAGGPILFLDNVKNGTKLTGDFMCSAITDSETSCRMLGKTGQKVVPTNMMVCACGNNVGVEGDLALRTVRCFIDAQRANPGDRTFKIADLKEYCCVQRPSLLRACLVILRAFACAQDRAAVVKDLKPMGGFDQWTAMVRAAIVWLGEVDPCESMQDVLDDDPIRERRRTFMVAWMNCKALGLRNPKQDSPDEPHGFYTLDQIISEANNTNVHGDDLSEALRAMMPHLRPGMPVTSRGLGKCLTAILGQVSKLDGGEYRFVKRRVGGDGPAAYALERREVQGDLLNPGGGLEV